jgi:hypothetical protein
MSGTRICLNLGHRISLLFCVRLGASDYPLNLSISETCEVRRHGASFAARSLSWSHTDPLVGFIAVAYPMWR